jgi:hypothetical protein
LSGKGVAFDRDDNPSTIRTVERAKTLFVREIEGEASRITQMKWREHKGIDDYIAAKGIKALDRSYANRSEIVLPKPKEERKTCGDTLLEIGKTATYFHTADKIPYADIWIEGNRHTYAVRSKAFRLWLSGEYLNRTEKGIGSQTLQDTLSTLEAIAIFRGETREVHLRTAEHQGKIYLDLGTPDWKAIEVDPSGWRIVNEPPVRFWRPDSLLPLPYPVEGGSLDELRELLNVDDSSWIGIVTFLMFCYRPNQVYPVLVLSAIRGSGKTTAAEIIKGLIDPGKAPLIALPSNTRDLAVAAQRRWLMVYDNVSHISNDESDNLCKLATGFGFSIRKLHTDDEETTIECTRPQIITAIDALVAREDLGDRVLLATLGEITPDRRLSHSELQQKIDDSKPRIFGALLTAMSQTLARLPHVQLPESPRMKDYALFSVAAEQALKLEDGAFLAAFEESRESIRQGIIEASPIGGAILSLMRDRLVWKGTASELLVELENHTDVATYRSRYFPKAANHLAGKLNRLKPELQALGIEVKDGVRSSNREPRPIILEKVIKVSSTSSTNGDKSLEAFQGGGLLVDDKKTSIVQSSSTNPESGRYLSSTYQSSSTHRPLTEPIREQGYEPLLSSVDDVDDGNTLFSKTSLENSKQTAILKVGDRVKPKDAYHVHGSDVGTVSSFDDWAVSVTWDDKSNGKYSADELEAIAS